MNIAVRYLSRGGNTKKVAEAIAKAAGVEALDCASPVTEPIDILFIGGAYYAFNVDEKLIAYIDALDPKLIGAAAVFGTSSLMRGITKKIAGLLRKKGVRVISESYYCKCKMSKGEAPHPNEQELREAEAFAERAIKESQS